MTNWQPIETAPKDGTVILLFVAPWVVAGYFDLDEDVYPWVWMDLDASGSLNGSRDDGTRPAHWMPLPEPPEAEE